MGRLILAIGLCLLFTSCSKPSTKTTHFRGWAMTMPYHIIVEGSLDHLEQEKILTIIQTTFDEVNTHYNSFNPQSEISKINQLNQKEPIKLSYELKELFTLCDQYVHLTQKHFDPTIGSVFSLWKEHFEAKKQIDNLKLETFASAVGWEKVHIKENSLVKIHPQTKLDLNAVAKGYAVDLLLNRIRSIGHKNLFVEWGGDLRVVGKHPLRKAWKIQILFPNTHKDILLYDKACATSGSFTLSSWEIEENNSKKTYFYIIDPFTKKPMKMSFNKFSYVMVLAPSCAQADALATAALTFPTNQKATEWAKQVVKDHPGILFGFYQNDIRPNVRIIKNKGATWFKETDW